MGRWLGSEPGPLVPLWMVDHLLRARVDFLDPLQPVHMRDLPPPREARLNGRPKPSNIGRMSRHWTLG